MEKTSVQERKKGIDKNLGDYYAFVFICNYCEGKFGCDSKHPTNCPICKERFLGRTSKLLERSEVGR